MSRRPRRHRRDRGSRRRYPKLERARELLRTIPRAAWVCALVACLNAACWSLVNPPFQIPDEPAHFAYTQQLAENHQLPRSNERSFSPEEEAVLRDLHQSEVQGSPEVHTISTPDEQRQLQQDMEGHLSRHGGGGVEGAHASPPLYYLLEAVPYGLASGGTLLDQLELMRLLSALMAGIATLFVFLFVRETLPAAPWAWTVAGLSVAFAPLLGYMGGAMNPDSMLAAVSAATFYCLAHAFRRGLSRGLAIALGGLIAVGFLTKLNFIGLAPGVVLGLVILSVRAARVHGRLAYGWLALALAIALAPPALYVLANLASSHPGLGVISTSLKLGSAHGSIFGKLSYVWQLYLPRLPGMVNDFPGLSTAHRLWFDRWVGFYGWLDTSFPLWVDNLALVPAGLIALLFVRSLVLSRAALSRCRSELVVYMTMTLGLLLLIGFGSFFNKESEGLGFAEPRYLLPLLALIGAALALAARGAGRRWGPVAGVAIVMLFLAHDIFSQMLVIGRFYG
jgi:4-amino-4-deoxy-L-arabinose transferase-like glycosyltransferase